MRNLWIFVVACALQAAESPFTKAQIPCHSEPCESKAKNPLAKLRFAINTLTFKANTLNVNAKTPIKFTIKIKAQPTLLIYQKRLNFKA